MDKVVARYRNGRVVKGLTADFTPLQDRFHIVEAGAETPQLREILVAELKGVFFVKDLAGDLGHAKSNVFDPGDWTPGRKVRVQFKDGEVLTGFTPDYLPVRAGFFLLPADLKSNTYRCFVIAAAAEKITPIRA
jgi:hypothetical protein